MFTSVTRSLTLAFLPEIWNMLEKSENMDFVEVYPMPALKTKKVYSLEEYFELEKSTNEKFEF